MELFAAASGDRSPLHADPAFARRTSFGECIVYGGLQTLAMLGVLPDEVLSSARSVRSVYSGPVLPDAPYQAHALRSRGGREQYEVRLTGRGKLLARVAVSTDHQSPAGIDSERFLGSTSSGRPGDGAGNGWPVVPGTEIAADYAVGDAMDELATRFRVVGLQRSLLEGIAWASNVVGMAIPGFDGLCAAVTISASSPGEASISPCARHRVHVQDYDTRTNRVLLEGAVLASDGAPRSFGRIECFPFTPTPIQAPVSAIALEPRERGRVVVVGGSRGAGAALSLALLRSGYTVDVVYAESVECASELRQLAGEQAENLSLHRCDAADPAAIAALAASIGGPIDGLVLSAARPALPMHLTPHSAGELERYVATSTGLAAVPIGGFAPLLSPAGAWVVIYSAAADANLSHDLPQFAAAKGALEGLAHWLAKSLPSTSVLVVRAPRMRTDLVNTPRARNAALPPQALASLIIDKLDGDELEPGVSIVEYEPVTAGELVR